MSRLPMPCLDCLSPTVHGSRCVLCDRAYQRRRRNSPALRGYDATYRRARLAVLGLPCALALPGCTGISDSADHIVPVSLGGAGGPLQPACRHCNSSRSNRPDAAELDRGAVERRGLFRERTVTPVHASPTTSTNPEAPR